MIHAASERAERIDAMVFGLHDTTLGRPSRSRDARVRPRELREKSRRFLLTVFVPIPHNVPIVVRSHSESAPGIGRVKRVRALVEGARSMAKKKKKAAKKAGKKKKGHG